MTSPGSISVWLEELSNGNESSGHLIWRRYVERLISLARRKMQGMQKRVVDEEDLVNAAFNSFFMGLRDGRFDQLRTRDDLWQVLVMLAERRIVDQRRQNLAKKRGGGEVRGESVFASPGNDEASVASMTSVASETPTPEFAAMFVDETASMMNKLRGDEMLQQIVLLKLQGFTHPEIAHQLQCSLSSIERKSRLIRELWIR